jgi:protein-tyrosine phosphatase
MQRVLWCGVWVLGAALASGCGRDPDAGMPGDVQRRHLGLEGAPNFRDLGGYATATGAHVKWHLLYRSDSLAWLTPADLHKVSQLGIRLVCDFRAAPEKQAEPDRLPAADPPAVADLPIGADSFMVKDLRARIASADLAGLDLRQMMIEANRQFATSFAPQYAAMFERLSQPANLPALVHCTAGKDRTGFAAALILTLLGVPRPAVMDDFLLTNHYTRSETRKRLWKIRLFSLFRADADALRPLFEVEREYLDAAFEAIDGQYGDFDTYRRAALGIDDAELAAVRALALE